MGPQRVATGLMSPRLGALTTAALVAGRIVVGGGTLVAPRRVSAAFGIPADERSALPYVGRLFGVRAVLMAALVATSGGDERRRQLRWGVAVDLVDAAAAVAAGRAGALPRSAAVLATGAALAEAALGAATLSAGRAPSPR